MDRDMQFVLCWLPMHMRTSDEIRSSIVSSLNLQCLYKFNGVMFRIISQVQNEEFLLRRVSRGGKCLMLSILREKLNTYLLEE